MTYLATEPREILVRAFKITNISYGEQWKFLQRSDAYLKMDLEQYALAWELLESERIIVRSSRTHRSLVTNILHYGYELTDKGRDELRGYLEAEREERMREDYKRIDEDQ